MSRQLPRSDSPVSLVCLSPAAFSLIEILVACAVMALLVALLASAFSGFASVTQSSGGRLDANNQVRTTFDRLGFDLASSVRNADLRIDFRKNAQADDAAGTMNDSLVLLADARSTEAGARLARVGYEVGPSADVGGSDCLLRCVEPFLWTDSTLNTGLTGAGEKQPLGRGIFRFELSFLKTDGTLVASPPAADEISAVICAAASLDYGTLAKLPGMGVGMSDLAAALPDAVDGKLPLSDWSPGVFSNLPRPVIQNTRFHQRYFYLR